MSQYVTKIRTNQGDKQIDYNALANLPTISNPNLLVNGDFQIWQRGDSFSNISNRYTADRWMIKNAKSNTSLVEKSVETPNGEPMCQSMYIKETVDDNTYLAYNFEHAIKGTYTLSFWYYSTTSISTYSHDNGSYVKLMDLAASSVWKRVYVSFYANAVDFINIIHAMKIGECHITGIKLEVGNTATPFMPKTYAQEVNECQRYYTKSNGIRLPVIHGSSSLFMTVPLSVTLRDTPTVTFGKTDIAVVRDDSAEAYNYTIGSYRVNTTNTHIVLEIGSSYNINTYKSGCVADDFPIFIDAEIY